MEAIRPGLRPGGLGDGGRLGQPAEVPDEVGVQAHVLDVERLGLRPAEDQFLDPADLLGGDRLLAQGVEQGPQLVPLGEVGCHGRPSRVRVRWTHSKSDCRIFASAL